MVATRRAVLVTAVVAVACLSVPMHLGIALGIVAGVAANVAGVAGGPHTRRRALVRAAMSTREDQR
jgi:hypothetical protein